MFATIRRYQGQKGTIHDVAQKVQAELVPMLASQPGFVSYTAVHAGNDVAVSMSVFRDRASAEAANAVATEWVKAHIGPLVGAPEITHGDVVATHAPEL
jgi:heme-degrading monooxygenase HmoA